MTEPRARAARHKGQLNFENELRALLFAFGDVLQPLPETLRVLDELVTDFIIETCHAAASAASYSNRQKVKTDDFMFAIRKNPIMLGRVQELLGMDKVLREARKGFEVPEGTKGLEKSGVLGRGEGRGRRGGGNSGAGGAKRGPKVKGQKGGKDKEKGKVEEGEEGDDRLEWEDEDGDE
ncbi:MAG: Transcription initiation factor TFIID subunit 13 [Icmadophila ericetorum]|nr:Transcription initiation factor TFIID subunit 13 [Icmadophila ericetorum]